MDNVQFLQLAAPLFASLAVAIITFMLSWPYLSGEKEIEKRLNGIVDVNASHMTRRMATEEGVQRKKAVADSLKLIEEQQKKSRNVPLRTRLKRAGLNVSVKAFYAASAACSLVCWVAAYLLIPSGLLIPNVQMFALTVIAAIGAVGIPRWVLSWMIKRRQAKFIDGLANALDIIVRGVKSGLPLNECIGIIARESQEPIASEFQNVVDAQRAGVPLHECFERLCMRMPLPEVRFFAIVISIQQSAGGSLSEVLGNLSGILRARKQLAAKVSALSAEAKASAMILGALPFVVMGIVYVSRPTYLEPLFTTPGGNVLLGIAVGLMLTGFLIMKKMINFKY
ncbi:MAG: type II secretion system F family protein [Pseudomonadota bacterium]